MSSDQNLSSTKGLAGNQTKPANKIPAIWEIYFIWLMFYFAVKASKLVH